MTYQIIANDGVIETLNQERWFKTIEAAESHARWVNNNTEHWASVYDEQEKMVSETP